MNDDQRSTAAAFTPAENIAMAILKGLGFGGVAMPRYNALVDAVNRIRREIREYDASLCDEMAEFEYKQRRPEFEKYAQEIATMLRGPLPGER